MAADAVSHQQGAKAVAKLLVAAVAPVAEARAEEAGRSERHQMTSKIR